MTYVHTIYCLSHQSWSTLPPHTLHTDVAAGVWGMGWHSLTWWHTHPRSGRQPEGGRWRPEGEGAWRNMVEGDRGTALVHGASTTSGTAHKHTATVLQHTPLQCYNTHCYSATTHTATVLQHTPLQCYNTHRYSATTHTATVLQHTPLQCYSTHRYSATTHTTTVLQHTPLQCYNTHRYSATTHTATVLQHTPLQCYNTHRYSATTHTATVLQHTPLQCYNIHCYTATTHTRVVRHTHWWCAQEGGSDRSGPWGHATLTL